MDVLSVEEKLAQSLDAASKQRAAATGAPPAEQALLANATSFSIAVRDEFLGANADKPILFVFGWDATAAAYVGPFTRGLRLVYVKPSSGS